MRLSLQNTVPGTWKMLANFSWIVGINSIWPCKLVPILSKGSQSSLLMLQSRSKIQKEVKSFVKGMKQLKLQVGLELRPSGCELLKDKEHILFILGLQGPASCLESSRYRMNE